MILKKSYFWLFLAVLLLFAGIRITLLEQKNLWFDEVYSWYITQGSFKDIIIQTAGDIHPPFYYFALKLWIIVFGDSVIALRSLSVFFSIISFFFLYKLSSKVLSKETTILVLIIYTLSPLNVYFAQEARMSMMNLCLNVISSYLFYRIYELYKAEKVLTKINYYLTAYILITLYSLYTHYFSIFILISHLAFIIYYHKTLKIKYVKFLILVYVIIFLAYMPWIPVLIDQIYKGQSWRHENTTISDVYFGIISFNNDIYYGFYYRFLPYYLFTIMNIFSVIVSAITLFSIVRIKLKREIEWNNFYLLSLAFIPFFIGIIISFKQWVEFFRYLSIIIPYLTIIFIYNLKSLNKYISYTIVFTVIIMEIIGINLYFNYTYKNNDYRQVMNNLQILNSDINHIFIYPHYFGWIMDYYTKQGEYKIPVIENYGWSKEMLLDNIKGRNLDKFIIILDNQTLDSTENLNIIKDISITYNLNEQRKFHLTPNTVDMYIFKGKKPEH